MAKAKGSAAKDNAAKARGAREPLFVELRGVRTHNLRSIDVAFRKNAFTAVVGLSGSGKSSLAVHTLAAEGLRRNWLVTDPMRSGAVLPVAADFIGPMPATYCFAGARSDETSQRTTVAAYLGVWQSLVRLFVREGEIRSPATGQPVRALRVPEMVAQALALNATERLMVMAPLNTEEGRLEARLDAARAAGFVRVMLDGDVHRLDDGAVFSATENVKTAYLVVDRVRGANTQRWTESIELALKWADVVRIVGDATDLNLERTARCPVSGWVAPRLSERLFSLVEGRKLEADAQAVFLWDASSQVWLDMPLQTACAQLRAVATTEPTVQVLVEQLVARLETATRLGLGATRLGTLISELSSGQRNLLALTCARCAELQNALLVFDEISTGIHSSLLTLVVQQLRALCEQNTVVLVEHRPELIDQVDQVIEVGPGAGREGGQIVFAGSIADFRRQETVTSKYLRSGQDHASIGDTASTLQVQLLGEIKTEPGHLVCLRSVGANKSLLLEHGIFRRLSTDPRIARVVRMEGRQFVRTVRSVVATVLGAMDPLRSVFAALPEARVRGYKAARFSFNVEGGRCEACEGTGLAFAQDTSEFAPPCTVCRGRRYEPETLEPRYRGHSIADVLDLPLDDVRALFESHRKIADPIASACSLGVGYLTLGRGAPSLSNGELQRLWLARELAKRSRGKMAYLFDEPTSGLHPEDALRFVAAVKQLCSAGHHVVVASVESTLTAHADLVYDCDAVVDVGIE